MVGWRGSVYRSRDLPKQRGKTCAKLTNRFASPESSELREILGRKRTMKSGWWNCSKKFRSLNYYHTHTYFLRHSNVEQMYPNDFAQWVATEVVIMFSESGLQSSTP